MIDGVNYSLIVRRSGTEGVCNYAITTGPVQPVISDSLLATGIYTQLQTVGSGRCDVYKVYIIEIETGVLITPHTGVVDNLV